MESKAEGYRRHERQNREMSQSPAQLSIGYIAEHITSARPLFISVCEGKRRPAPRDQLSHRFRDHTPGCGSDLSIRIDERGHSLCRNRTCKRQGRRQAEITTDFVV